MQARESDFEETPSEGVTSPEGLARRTARAYLIFGTLWIVLGDLILVWFGGGLDSEGGVARWLLQLEILKGLFFVVATSAGLFWYSRRQASRLLRSHQESDRLLAEREARQTLAIECSREGVWELDFARKRGQACDNTYALLRYPDPGSRPDPYAWLDLVHPQDLDRVDGRFQAHLRGETDYFQEEFRLPTGDGDWLWVESRGRVSRRGPDGAPLHMVGTIADITDRRQVEARRLLLERGIEVAAEGVLITDAEGAIQYVNPALERMTGWSAEELLGENPRIFKSGAHPPEFYEDLWQTVLSGEVWSGRTIDVRKDGTRFVEEGSIAPVVVGGEVTALIGFKREVTREEELQRQLLQSQKLEAMGTLARGVAHDFNNLLGVVVGALEVVLERLGTGQDAEEYVHKALDTTERAARLTRKILTFSTPEDLPGDLVDLRQLVLEVCPLLRTGLPPSVELVVEAGDAPCGVQGDRTSLEQVLVNLVTNAGQAMAEPGGRVRVGLETAAEVGVPRVALVVEDDGPGIPPEIQSRIFDPFFTTKAPGEGSGLGLSVVHGIVDAHGASIQVDSGPGEGTRFRVEFPRVALPTPVASPASSEPGDAGEEPRKRAAHIVVVDDEDDLRRLVGMFLERAGHEVRLFESAHEALEAVQGEPDWPDLVVTDYSMPRMDGQELARGLKAIREDLPVLLQTGFGQSLETPESGRPFDLRLSKPMRRRDLLEAVDELLAG